ncbi:MAG: TolC family protein [Pirellulaceae bacterium]
MCWRLALLTLAIALPAADLTGVNPSGTAWGQGVLPQGQSRQDDTRLRAYAPLESIPAAPPAGRESPADQQPFTLADLEGIALRNNPALAVAGANVESARGTEVQAGLYPNPVVGYHAMQIGNLDTAGQQGAFITQRFITAGKRRLDRSAAGWGVRQAEFQFETQRQRVLTDVRIRFHDALIAQRRLDLTRSLTKISDQFVELTQRLLADRQASENTLLQAEIEAEQSAILLDNAREENDERWRRLAASIGVPTMQVAPLAGDPAQGLPQFDWNMLYARTVADSPQIAAAVARRERALVEIVRAQREVIPDVDVTTSVRHDNITGYDVTNLQVGIPIPVLDRNQGGIQRARAEAAAAQSDVRRLELQLQERLAAAFRQYGSARRQAERYACQILPRATRSLELVSDGYNKGQTDFLTLLTAQRTFIQTNLSYLDSLQQLRRAIARIEGRLLEDSLGDPRQ